MDHHKEATTIIAAHVRRFYEHKEGSRIYHGSANSTRRTSFHRDSMIDTSHLIHILKLDITSKIALVEPNVPLDQLVEATLKHGLISPGITIGGGFASTSGESSSFKYGFFEDTINWIEIVLVHGTTMTASETENPDLFYGATGSVRTLGVTTLLELCLIEAKAYVEVIYHPVTSVSDAIKQKEDLMTDSLIDYL